MPQLINLLDGVEVLVVPLHVKKTVGVIIDSKLREISINEARCLADELNEAADKLDPKG